MLSAAALQFDLQSRRDSPNAKCDAFRSVCLADVPDFRLASAAAANDMRALGELYERHRGKVYAVCLKMTRNGADAEDLTQEVFISLVTKIGSYSGKSQFSTWLHRVTVNCVLMYFRRPSRREHTFTDLGNTTVVIPRLTPCSENLTDRMSIRSAIRQLPRGSRAVFELFAIAGFEHEEIARLLGCSAGTSKSQLHRARIKLRKELKLN